MRHDAFRGALDVSFVAIRVSSPRHRRACLAALALIGTLSQVAAAPSAPQSGKADEKGENPLPKEGWTVEAPKDALEPSSYLTLKGKHCAIKTTVSREAARDIARFVDLFLIHFSKVFTARFEIQGPLTTVVFAHEEEFNAYYADAYASGAADARRALYSPHKKETWVVLQGEDRQRTLPVETTRHELVHHMLHFFTGEEDLPPWFTEGAACYFQYWEVGDTMKENISQNFARARGGDYGYFPTVILKRFATPGFLPPDRLMKLDYAAFHTKDADFERLHYSESWALVNFLTTTKRGQTFLDRITTALRKGQGLDKLMGKESLESLRVAWYEDIEKRLVPGLKENAGSKASAR